jgi:hypothetical protein
MKRILVALPVIFSLFMLNSCDNKDLDNDDSGDKIIRFQIKALELGANVIESQGTTRLDVENCKFENGDEIGLFAVKRRTGSALSDDDLKDTDNFIHNARLTYDESSRSWISNPPLYYPEDRATLSIDFYAYYPYRRSVNPNDMDISGAVLTNQEGRSTLGKSDFMTASVRGYEFDGKEVELVFKHHFSLVRFDCKATAPNAFNSVAVSVQEYSVNKFKLIPVALGNKDLTYERSEKKIAIGMHEQTLNVYEALVIPQTFEKGQNAPLFYCFNDEDKSFFYIYSEKQIKLNKGDKYTFFYK